MAASDTVQLLLQDFIRRYGTSLDVVYLFGAICGLKKVMDLASLGILTLRTYVFRPGSVGHLNFPNHFGEWAVITGATSGLGLAFADELASRGMKVILIGKSRAKLQNAVDDIKKRHGTEVVAIEANFSYGAPVFEEIEETISSYQVGILVNNVSITYNYPKYFTELSIPNLTPGTMKHLVTSTKTSSKLWQMINVNVAGITLMTRQCLKSMIKRRKGVVINVCPSGALTGPRPLLTGYSATMAYVEHFSESLQAECASKGVIVQCLCPVSVAEGEDQTPSLLTPSPQTYVRHALKTLGVTCNTHGYFPHALQGLLAGLIPAWLRLWAILNNHKRQRKGMVAQETQRRQFLKTVLVKRLSQPSVPVHSTGGPAH